MMRNLRPQNPPIVGPQQQGVVLQLVPEHVCLIIVEPGTGKNPQPGKFITLRQQTYVENGLLIAQGRRTYVRGRGRLIQGLQLGLAMVKQGMRGRFVFSSQYAYGSQQIDQMPVNSSVTMNFQVSTITDTPKYCQKEEQETIKQIIYLSKTADKYVGRGQWYQAMNFYTQTMRLVLEGKMNQQKKRLYDRVLMAVHIKAIETAYIVRDYYQVIIWAQKYFDYPGKGQDSRCLMARAASFINLGEFDLAQEDLKKVQRVNPNYHYAHLEYQNLLNKKSILYKQGYDQRFDVLPISGKFEKIDRISFQLTPQQLQQPKESLNRSNKGSNPQQDLQYKILPKYTKTGRSMHMQQMYGSLQVRDTKQNYFNESWTGFRELQAEFEEDIDERSQSCDLESDSQSQQQQDRECLDESLKATNFMGSRPVQQSQALTKPSRQIMVNITSIKLPDQIASSQQKFIQKNDLIERHSIASDLQETIIPKIESKEKEHRGEHIFQEGSTESVKVDQQDLNHYRSRLVKQYINSFQQQIVYTDKFDENQDSQEEAVL